MAYTYDNFVSAANAAGLMNQFSEQDLQIAQRNPEFGLSLLSLLKDNSNATTAEQQLLATEAANQLRKSYGVYNTGTLGTDSAYAGSYGTQINDLMDQIKNYGSFDYANQDEYQKLLDQVSGYGSFNYSGESAYKDAMDKVSNYGSYSYDNQGEYQKLLEQITSYGPFNYANQSSYQQLLDSIVNQTPFSYDLQSDPSWGSYKKAYMREGDRASANALAQASAASGGRASSYAMTAAQQAGNYYAGQLADIIPTLEQNAYSRYLSDFNNRLSSLGAMESDRAFGYQAYLDKFNQLQNGLGALESDRAFDYQNWMNEYNMLQNDLNNIASDRNFDYQAYLDKFAQLQSGLGALQSDRDFDYENWMNGYNMLQNSLGNYQNQDATDYQRYLDALNFQRQQEQAQQAQKQQEFQNAMALYQSTGHVTPELAAILGIPATGNGGNTGVTGTGGVIGDNSSDGSRGGYDNGTLKPEQIQELQRVLGVTDDGKYGTKSKAAAGGLSAEEAYEKYVQNPGGLYQEMLGSMVENVGADEIDTSNYSVTNKTTADGIIIGGRRMTWTELIEAVNQGRVIETIDTKNGTITYTSSLKMDDSPATNGGGAGKKPFTMTQLGAN